MASLLVKLVGTSINGLSYLSKSQAAKTALTLFSKPRKGQITRAQEDFLNTAIKEKLELQSHSIMTYHWEGPKQTVLLVHGWESNSGRWKPLVGRLKNEGYNLVALDAPAHGQSGGFHFNALLYADFIHVVAEKHQPYCIVGHSVGGMSAVFYQQKHPKQHLEKMVLLGAPSNFKDILKRYTNMLQYNKSVINGLNSLIQHRFGASPEAFSTASFLKEINSQGLIVHDKEDPIIPYQDALEIHAHFKNSKLITTKGLGHSLNHKSVSQHISEFIEV